MAKLPGPKPPARRKIDFDKIGNKVLVALYQSYMESRNFYLTFQEIVSAVPDEPKNAIWDELKDLINNRTVSQNHEERTENAYLAVLNPNARRERYSVAVDGYKITKEGIAIVNDMSDEAYETYAADVDLKKETGAKGQADQWEPIALDRGSTEFKKALEATETAVNEIEGSNGYAATNPEERNSIVETLKAHLKLFKEGLISKGQAIEGLIKPLRFIATKFSDASMGEMAKRAVNFLINLFS